MRILCVSDIHGRQDKLAAILDREPPADILVIAGDITNRGTPAQARAIIRLAKEYSPRVLAVAGNCDSKAIEQILVEEDVDLHARWRVIDGCSWVGLSGVPSGIPWNYRFSEREFADWLSRHPVENSMSPGRILVSHTPPRGLCDRTHFRTEAGSRSVRDWVDRTAPALVICGHIHEAHGQMRSGTTEILNCGPAYKHRYASAFGSFSGKNVSITTQIHDIPQSDRRKQ